MRTPFWDVDTCPSVSSGTSYRHVDDIQMWHNARLSRAASPHRTYEEWSWNASAGARGAEPAGVTPCNSKLFRLLKRYGHDSRYHELSNSVAARDAECFLTVVYKQHLNLAAVIGVDGAGRIQHRNAMAMGKPRSRAHLRFKPCRQLDHDPSRHQGALSRCKPQRPAFL